MYTFHVPWEPPTGINRQWNQGYADPSTIESGTLPTFRGHWAQDFIWQKENSEDQVGSSTLSQITKSISWVETMFSASQICFEIDLPSDFLLANLVLSCERLASPRLCLLSASFHWFRPLRGTGGLLEGWSKDKTKRVLTISMNNNAMVFHLLSISMMRKIKI